MWVFLGRWMGEITCTRPSGYLGFTLATEQTKHVLSDVADKIFHVSGYWTLAK